MTENRYLEHNPKTVALICMGPSIIDAFNETLTQEFSLEWADETWAINMASNIVYHDVVFWMDDLVQQHAFRPKLIEALRKRDAKHNLPVITSKAYRDLLPNSYDYPIQEVSQISIPFFGKPYLNNGVAMALGYAIWKGVKTIKIYGADFSYPNRDYAESGRGCVEAWIAIGCFRGLTVALSPTTSLLDTVKDGGIYGYAEQPDIRLPNGQVFKYAKIKGSAEGRYVPEDSSSAAVIPGSRVETATNERFEHAPAVPGANGGVPAVAGPAELRPVQAQVAPQAATRRSRKGVRSRNRSRRDEGANPAGNSGSGIAGSVPPTA